jgi:tRNA(Ile)-lysidine synthase
MIRILGNIPHKCTVAFSGGVDSVATVDFLLNGRKEVDLAFFHHGTETSTAAMRFVVEFAADRNLRLSIGRLSREKFQDESFEEFWRNERHRFFATFDSPVITAHHLDDAIETWIFTSLHGENRLIPYSSGNVIHPFLITPKKEFVSWCKRKKLKWIEDESNCDVRFMRNLIRHKIVPEALKVNPGLHKVIKKKYINKHHEFTA